MNVFIGSALFHANIISHTCIKFPLGKESTASLYFLGLNVKQHNERITLHQQNYIRTVEPVETLDGQNKTKNLLTSNEKRL